MSRVLPAVATATLFVLAQACHPGPRDMSNAPGLVHQVYFWLAPGLDSAARADFVAGMRGLSDAPTVGHVTVGTPAATPARDVTDNTFDYFLTLHFEDVAAHDAYQVSDVHEAFVAAHAAKFREVRVFDGAVVE